MWVLAASLASASCVWAAAERLRKVHAVRHFDWEQATLTRAQRAAALESAPPYTAEHEVAEAFAAEPPNTAEHEVAEAFAAEPPTEPASLSFVALDQVMFEVDFLLSRWARVPVMAARIASSLGFLLAAGQLRSMLAADDAAPASGLPLAMAALQTVSVAMAGMSLCLALGREATRVQKREALRLEAWIDSLAPAEAEVLAPQPTGV